MEEEWKDGQQLREYGETTEEEVKEDSSGGSVGGLQCKECERTTVGRAWMDNRIRSVE
jgi:hypothetical protein